MELKRNGATRWVLLVGKFAFKFPGLFSWKMILNGLLANMQEADFGRGYSSELVPVLFYIPGGFLVVQPRCEPLIREVYLHCLDKGRVGDMQILQLNNIVLQDAKGNYLPVELKEDSFGWLNGKILAVDYGS